MISASSNCSRVDAVKASANTLRLQLSQHAKQGSNDGTVRNAEQQLQSVDQQVKSNNANQAELALSAAKLAVAKLDVTRSIGTQPTNTAAVNNNPASSQRRLDIYA